MTSSRAITLRATFGRFIGGKFIPRIPMPFFESHRTGPPKRHEFRLMRKCNIALAGLEKPAKPQQALENPHTESFLSHHLSRPIQLPKTSFCLRDSRAYCVLLRQVLGPTFSFFSRFRGE